MSSLRLHDIVQRAIRHDLNEEGEVTLVSDKGVVQIKWPDSVLTYSDEEISKYHIILKRRPIKDVNGIPFEVGQEVIDYEGDVGVITRVDEETIVIDTSEYARSTIVNEEVKVRGGIAGKPEDPKYVITPRGREYLDLINRGWTHDDALRLLDAIGPEEWREIEDAPDEDPREYLREGLLDEAIELLEANIPEDQKFPYIDQILNLINKLDQLKEA